MRTILQYAYTHMHGIYQMVFNKSTDNETTEPHHSQIIYIIFFLFLHSYSVSHCWLLRMCFVYTIVFNIKIIFISFDIWIYVHIERIFRCDFDYALLFDFLIIPCERLQQRMHVATWNVPQSNTITRTHNAELVALSSPTHIQIIQWETDKNTKRKTHTKSHKVNHKNIFTRDIDRERERERKERNKMHMIKIDQMVERTIA